MLARICYVSHTGKVRQNNEDSLLINGKLVSGADMESPECLEYEGRTLLLSVADGMGGHSKGEVASRTVLDEFRTRYEEVQTRRQIADVLRAGRERLNRLVEADRTNYGLGTTLSGMVLKQGKGIVFNCGDSRVYRRRGDSLEKMTKDHSLVQELADTGVITEAEMRNHPQKNIVTSAIMGDLGHELPLFSVDDVEVINDDILFLCTDGVWESVSDGEMGSCLRDGAQRGIRCIYDRIFEAGARDNLSMIAVEITERDSPYHWSGPEGTP
jgi:serine/threonine protein phosphatase PrpC